VQLIDGADAANVRAQAAVVASGAFDGVHVGHQAVVDRMVHAAAELRVPSIVVTWDPPGPAALADLAQRLAVFDALGVEVLCLVGGRDDVVPAVTALGAGLVVSGPNSEQVVPDIAVEWIDAVTDETGAPITADAVRAALSTGDVEQARMLLGRSASVRGVVERGDGRGRDLGFPTANVAVAGNLAIPADGVYGGRYLRPDGVAFTAAISVGRRPTFYNESGLRLVEAYLLDFEGDLYGEETEVVFESWVRDQVRYDGIDELIAQMNRDVAEVRARATTPG
jgi:riboflavin kinase/FMN adenylyltransferase